MLQEHLAAIVESSDDAIISKDLNGIIQTWNRAAERIFGYTPEEIVGRHISTLAAPDRIDEIPAILARISRGERIDHYQTKRVTKDGRVLSISLTISPIYDASGKVVGASKIARDVTEQEKIQHALREANEMLARSNADLEHFAYCASHDLQEPLRMVSIYSEMLRTRFGSQLGATGAEYLSYISEGAERMAQLLADLRVFVQASKVSESPKEGADAESALQRTLEVLKNLIESTGASISHHALPKVHMHSFQLEQLFQNLLTNAIRYCREGRPKVHVAARHRDRHVEFSVTDNGIGIDPHYKDQIFGMFKRLHTSADYPGTGMGLAICQRIVETSGGRIWVESEVGKGSTFFFTVPEH